MNFFNYEKFDSLVKQYAKSISDPTESIDKGKPNEIIKILKRLKHHDEFYIAVDMRTQKPIWHFGIDTYLGYDKKQNDELSFDFFTELIHPFVRQWAIAYIAGMYKCILENKLSELEFLKTRYVVNLPIRKSNGNYMLVKQIGMPFQFDRNGKMVSFLNSYFIVDKYKGEPLKPRLFSMEKPLKKDQELLMMETSFFLNIPPQNLLTIQEQKGINAFKKALRYDSDILAKVSDISAKSNQHTKLNTNAKSKISQRLKKRLEPLIDIQEDKDFLRWLPNLKNTKTFVDFMIGCGIVDVLECYQELNADNRKR